MEPLPDFPEGWYALASSAELSPGAVLTRRLAGKEIVLFRDGEGFPAGMDAYCPHLGAHMGVGGTVEGGALRCPFHGFRFDREGRCVSTAYGGKAPPAAKARARSVVDRNGFVLVWSGPAAPAWEVPALETEGWTPPRVSTHPLASHPQETTENSVDVGHFEALHGFRDVGVVRPLKTDGPFLGATYRMRHPTDLFGLPGLWVDAEFEIQAYGLGYSLVLVNVLSVGMRTRQWVLSTPTEPGRIELRLATSVPAARSPRLAGPAGRAAARLATAIQARVVQYGFVHDTSQDFAIWQNKRYVQPPALAAGDGPIGRYRQWAKQFYPGP